MKKSRVGAVRKALRKRQRVDAKAEEFYATLEPDVQAAVDRAMERYAAARAVRRMIQLRGDYDDAQDDLTRAMDELGHHPDELAAAVATYPEVSEAYEALEE